MSDTVLSTGIKKEKDEHGMVSTPRCAVLCLDNQVSVGCFGGEWLVQEGKQDTSRNFWGNPGTAENSGAVTANLKYFTSVCLVASTEKELVNPCCTELGLPRWC